MKIGLLGMGTIGSGVFEQAALTEEISVKRVLENRFVRDYTTTDIADITSDPEIELVAETMGGLHPAYEFAKAVLEAGKHFVTANKLLVSVYGPELDRIAREKGVAFLYSAACGGGIPYLTNMKLARGMDEILSLGGILNGTTNFILDSMQKSSVSYDDALKKAQELGYAERDPSSDVDGLDTMRKLILACAVAFDAIVDEKLIPVYGISSVKPCDIAFIKEQGMALRLCAYAEKTSTGVGCCVEPTLVKKDAPEAAIEKNINYAWYVGKFAGQMSYTGQGAGKDPTATNVLRDVLSVLSGNRAMTRPSLAPSPVYANVITHSYYARIPGDQEFPTDRVGYCVMKDGYRFIITEEMSVRDMHKLMSGRKDAFFAGIK